MKAREPELLEAYLTVAMREGVENVTLQKIAAEAGVAYSTVHYYFGSGEQTLIDRALAHVANASEAFMESQVTPAVAAMDRNALTAYVEAKFEWGRRFPTYASMLSYFIYQTTRDAAAKRLSTQLHQSMIAKVQALLLGEIGKGHYPTLKNLQDLAPKIVTILNGALLAATTTEKSANLRGLAVQMIDDVITANAR